MNGLAKKRRPSIVHEECYWLENSSKLKGYIYVLLLSTQINFPGQGACYSAIAAIEPTLVHPSFLPHYGMTSVP